MARINTDVCTISGLRPAAFMRRPDSSASLTPCSLRGTSVQPVKRFSRFHVLWPWRSRMSVPGFLPVPINLGSHLDDVLELLGVEACAADEDAIAQRQLHVSLHVFRVDAAAVQDAHLARRSGADHPPHPPQDA